MADKLEGMPSTMQLVDPETGQINDEWWNFFEELVFGSSERSVGTILSGLNTTTGKTDAIIAGTQTVSDVFINGRGSLVAEQDAQNQQGADNAAASSSFAVTSNKSSVSGNATSGTITSDTATISISGGSTPYSIAVTKASGETFTQNLSSSSLGSDGSVTVSFSIPWADGQAYSGSQKVTVTDNGGAVASVSLSVSLYDTDAIGTL